MNFRNLITIRRFQSKIKTLIFVLCLMIAAAPYGFQNGEIKTQKVEAASGDVILLWDGTTSTIPAGWTCVSCRTTDGASATTTFLNAFPQASSSYANATSGTDLVTPTVTFSSASNGASVGQSSASAGTAFPLDTHTHTWGNPTLNSENIMPPFVALIFIKASNPSQIPQGAIAMFAVSSASLPTNWSYYSGMENNYLRGSNSTSTGGSTSVAATTTAVLTSGNTSGSLIDPGNGLTAAGPTHNHTIAAGSALSSQALSPSYVGVVFGQATATTSIPTGMLAFFDTTPPSGWVATSTNGSIFDNRLLIGSSTFGNTGGVTTYNHGGSVVWTSSGPSATAATKSGSSANTALQTHTHNITYTVSSVTAFPTRRAVIIGQKLAPFLTQQNYQWYTNTNSDTPTPSLAAVNTSTTVNDGDVIRLRMNVSVATSALSAQNQFKLQFQANATSGAWSDVGLQASSSAWIGYDNTNATTTDGLTLSGTLVVSSTVAETYEEENPSAGTPNAVTIGGFGEWDWVLKANGVIANTNYFFRMVASDGTVLNSYARYPAVTSLASTISISGTCKQFDQTTNCADSETVQVAVNGSLQVQTGTTSGGSWIISGVTQPGAAGDVITVFVTSTTASVRAGAVTKWVSGNVSSVNLFERSLTIGSADNQTITNTNISQFDNSVAGDANVFWEVDGSSNLNFDTNNLFTDERLFIRAGNTYQPDATGANRIITGQNIFTSSTATLTANGSTFRLGQDFINNGTFTQGTSTVEFSGATSTVNCSSCTFYNLTASSTATVTATSSFTVSNILNVVGTLSINSGRTVTASATTTLSGTISGIGTITFPDTSTGPGTSGILSSIARFDASAANVTSSTFINRVYGGLVEVYASSASSRVIFATSSTYTLNGGLNILAGGAGNTTLQATTSNPTIVITGNLGFAGTGAGSEIIQSGTGTWSATGNVDFTGGTYTAATGNTLIMNGSGTLTSNSQALQNLTLSGTVTLAAATHTINGALNMAGGAITSTGSTIVMTGSGVTLTGGSATLNNLTASSTGTITLQTSDLTVGGTFVVATSTTFSIASGITLTHSGSALTLNGTISGSGRYTYQSATTFPTSGTISSILRMDATNANQTIPARTYGGAVEIFNNGSTNRTVTLNAGTYTFNSSVYLYANGSASTTLDGATNNATGTISSIIDYLGTGGGQETILLSSAPWTIGGGLDISGGNFTAPTGILNIGGNFTNTGGTFTHNSGTVVLNGSSQQTLSGTMDGASAFNILTITNNSGDEVTPSVVFNATTTAATSTITTASTTVQFNASSTFSFTNINWNGQATTTKIKLRSSIGTSTAWFLNVSNLGAQTVRYIDVKDSDASFGNEISATDGTNVNSGGNTNWAFSITAPLATSTADDIFEINAASTTISNINITSGGGSPGGRISSSSDIRLRIPGTFNAVWDVSVITITCSAGDACARISTTGVTYESSNSIAVIDALQNFVSGEWVQIQGLKMGNFSAVNASTTVLNLRVDGAADAIDDATDTGKKTIKGLLVEGNHAAGQADNVFDTDNTSVTSAALFKYDLVPTGENMTMTTTTINLSNVSGFAGANITSPRLYLDANSNGSVDGGDTALGATGTVSIAGSTGTIVLGGTWTATTTSNIILQADVSSIDSGDSMTFSLPSSNVNARGATTLELITLSGSVVSVNHGKSIRALGGGGGASGGAPPASGSQGGGGPGGGGGTGDTGGGAAGGAPPGGGSQGGGGAGGGEGGAP